MFKAGNRRESGVFCRIVTEGLRLLYFSKCVTILLKGIVAMLILYSPRRSSGFMISGVSHENQHYSKIKYNAKKLLIARGNIRAADYLDKIPFRICDALSNGFEDDIYVLSANVPLELYEDLRLNADKTDFKSIADVITEIGPYIGHVGVELELNDPANDSGKENGLKDRHINKLVYGYIGVSGGYLGDFSYRTHHQFYTDMDLDINPNNLPGTTRERFIHILKTSFPETQAKILKGILERYPVGSSDIRTQEKHDEIVGWASELLSRGAVSLPDLQTTSDIVSAALADASELITSRGAVSGVDRMHTALHGYLRAVCAKAGMEVGRDASITELFKVLRENHSAFSDLGTRSDDIMKVLRAHSTVIDALNPIRNRATIAHPNEELLDEPEAILVINSIRTLLQYVDSKISSERS